MPAEYSFVSPPTTPVVRVGRAGKNLWLPKGWADARDDGTFGYRFDDPGGTYNPPILSQYRFQVIYCATWLAGAVGEVCARQRPELAALAARGLGGPEQGYISQEWCRTRAAGYTTLDPGLLFVDVAATSSVQALRESQRLAALALQHGYNDIDRSLVLGQDRRFTQEIARVIYEGSDIASGGLPGQPLGKVVAGIRYESRHPTGWECWALFHTRVVHYPGEYDMLDVMDKDVREAASVLGLKVKTADGVFEDPLDLLR